MVMPMDLGIRIPAEDSVRELIEVTERLDYESLYKAYSRHTEADEATPKQMFQLTILGFMNGIYSTRGLSRACGYDIRFMWILGDRRAPSHNGFARFISKRLKNGVAEDLFYQLVKLLQSEKEITGENLFVDGTKLEANASRYSYVWGKSVSRNAERLKIKQEKLVSEARNAYPFELAEVTEVAAVVKELRRLWEADGEVKIQQKGKRRPPLQRYMEALNETLEKQQAYESSKQILKKRGSYSKTDHDATFMRMKDDHTRKGQLKPAYNVQLGVEGEYIVGADIVSDCNDTYALLPLLRKIEAKSGIKHKNIVADAGYESEENYTFLEQCGKLAYIKPQNYEKSKKRSYRKNAYLRENMPYDKLKDAFLCPGGKWLTHEGEIQRPSKSGFIQTVSVYAAQGCASCPLKAACTKAEENRSMTFSKSFDRQRALSRQRLISDAGILLRLNRSIQSEGTFGVLKEDWGFRRFLRRGGENVMTELLLYAFAFNTSKLHTKIVQNRLQRQLIIPCSAS